MKSLRINLRALGFDGKAPLQDAARVTHDSSTGSHDVSAQSNSPLAKLGVLRVRDLVARGVIAATDHLFAASVGHSGQAGVTQFSVRSCHVAFGRQIDTSPTRTADPSTGTGQVGPFVLGPTDELVLTSNGQGEQVVTLELMAGSAVEVERMLDRKPAAQPSPSVGHAATHASGGGDQLDVTGLTGLLLTPQTPASHASTHQSGQPDALDVTGLTGLLLTPQTPASHADDHKSGGDDVIRLDELGTPSDTTTLNASTSYHGLLRKLSGSTSQFLRGDGTWAVPSLSSSMAPIFLSPAEAIGDTAAAIYSGSEMQYLSWPDSATTDHYWHFRLPSEYGGGSLQLTLHWACATATSGDVRVVWSVRRFVAGEYANASNSAGTNAAYLVSGVAHLQTTQTITVSADSAVAGNWVRLRLGRYGTFSTDTYAGEMRLFGVLVSEV